MLRAILWHSFGENERRNRCMAPTMVLHKALLKGRIKRSTPDTPMDFTQFFSAHVRRHMSG